MLNCQYINGWVYSCQGFTLEVESVDTSSIGDKV